MPKRKMNPFVPTYSKGKMYSASASVQGQPLRLRKRPTGVYQSRALMSARSRTAYQTGTAEHKTFDFNGANAAVIIIADPAVGPSLTPFAPVAGKTGGCINQVPIGTASTQRIGRKFLNTAVHIRGSVFAATTGTAAKGTMLLIHDKSIPVGVTALPAWTAILNAQSPDSFTLIDNANRFKILRRWDYTVTGNQTAGQITDCGVQTIDEYVKLPGGILTELTQADSSGTYLDMKAGALLLYFVGNQTGAANPVFEINTRVYFSDL